MHVNQSALVETVRESCKSGLDGSCFDGIRPQRTFLEIFDAGDCSGGIIGGTQILFRDLPKLSNIRKIFTSSC